MRVVVVPAPIVASGHGVPRVCCRHGEPATEHHDLTFRSRVPFWLLLLTLFIGLPALIIAVLIQRKVPTPAWPFCPRCVRSLTVRRIVIVAVFVTLLLCAALSVIGWVSTRDERPGAFVAGFVFSVLLLIFAVQGITLATPSRVANGYVAENGMTVEFRNPDPDFLRQIVAAKAEFQHYLRSVGPQPMAPAPPPF
ncbi:hypothetical protein AB0M54_14010 [Actinoplanes sp. NPDC051470]|uniref:hypothetical protein n=1 Tax=unclassified Actinoplanes TaxID=2626549 RepID=UPI003414C0D2